MMSTDTRAAGVESDSDFVERMEADRALVDITVPGPIEGSCDAEFERLVALARRAVTPPAAQASEEEVERVARAICASDHAGSSDPWWRLATPEGRDALKGYARAALSAIRADTAAAEQQPAPEPKP